MESGVPSLELLHDALEEPVRPLQQAGALHRPLNGETPGCVIDREIPTSFQSFGNFAVEMKMGQKVVH